MLSFRWDVSTFHLTIPSKAEIVFLCFILSGADIPNRSGILAEQCDCFEDQTFKAFCALSQSKKNKTEIQK